MDIPAYDELSDVEAQEFARRFLGLFLSGAFGALTKREAEILIFHLLRQTSAFADLDTYALATKLRISEARITTFRAESALRYRAIDRQAILERLAKEFFASCDTRPGIGGDMIEFALDDPVVAREFIQAARELGYHTDTSFNRSIIKVPAYVFAAVFADVFPHVQDGFANVVERHTEKNDAIRKEVLDAHLSPSQKAEAFLRRHDKKTTVLKDLLSLIPLAAV